MPYNPLTVKESKWLTCLALAGIAAVALWLRLHRLGDHSLWVDEGFSVHFVHTRWAQFWKVTWSREANMLLYYLLLRPWAQFAVTEFQIRLLSALFGVGGVLMICALGRELFSRATGLVASALLAVHAFHVYYSQEARSYPFTVFLLMLAAWLFVRLVREPDSRRNQWAYAIAAALAFYAHIFALLVVVSEWLAFFVWAQSSSPANAVERSSKREQVFGAIRRFFAMTFPLVIFAIFKNKGQLDWIPPLTWPVFMRGMTAVTGQGGTWLLALYVAMALVAVICGFRTPGVRSPEVCSDDAQKRFALLLAVSWALFPTAVFMLYSLHKPLFLDRYLVLLVPAFVLLAAQGVVTLANLGSPLRLLWIPALALLLTLSFRATWRQYDAIKWLDWQTPTHFVVSHLQPDDVLCFTAPGSESFWYYWQREKQFDWYDLPRTYYKNGTLCTAPFDALSNGQNHAGERAWLITTTATPEQEAWIKGILSPRFGPAVLRQEFASPPLRLTVELMAGPPANR